MDYIVFDLEWNQAAPGKYYANKKLPFEIIEIGAVKLNSDMQEIGRFNEMVRPKVYKNLNKITGSLVQLEMSQLRKARTFPEVMEAFLSFCGKDYLFCTWGNLDLIELQRNMKFYHMTPISKEPIKFLDVQKLFSLEFEGRKSQHALEYAVDYLKIEKNIPFHRAYDDAYYTARVLEVLSPVFRKRYSFDTYVVPKNKKEEIRIQFDDYYKYISREFDTKSKALSDKEVNDCGCYLCKRQASRELDWFSVNGKHYYSVSRCKKHGFIKGKIRLRKTENGTCYVIKTMKQITDQQVEELLEKQEKLKNPL